jgi:hypothetical protein
MAENGMGHTGIIMGFTPYPIGILILDGGMAIDPTYFKDRPLLGV